MSAPPSLNPGHYVIFAESPNNTNTTTPQNGRSNFAVTCPLAAESNFSTTPLIAAASAAPTQVWLITGDGMILSKAAVTGTLAQSPVFYASYTNNSPNIVTISGTESTTPTPSTKFVFFVSQVAKTDKGDALSYLATVMTADNTDQFWTIDSATQKSTVQANNKSSAKNFVFVPV